MQGQTFQLLLNGVPYFVKAEPFSYNDETRFKVSYNNGDEHIFAWNTKLGQLSAIDDDAISIPDELEAAISSKLLNTTVA
ncbi:hypothetical protein [Flavisolibacter ginsenosidimutans]|uniref:Uncharacterized protein n=1 Tax=Flavisolibacter ginsenosidimutans TaxID=661481 RepID=A0A5B8UFM5_9BACT|nr:hypothetical protein [Flavisolibacter ginsenosidimutans]QEC55106.1 hypothetical protein FSB75_04025 [Flavisolibacter ginsenosidimutans]